VNNLSFPPSSTFCGSLSCTCQLRGHQRSNLEGQPGS